ncbi:2-amino-4-hydroxy-6-hydroxymethyldihyropteridine pyrophosphokinase [Wigglesworthia glossinidia endosymbiont of Glossina morsitans morsitans (Yale colony)]|uniref:2-amino-4-hydroxy-6-hydroxymethyldihydropteridine pyrophosphokinase n=1 Tax=Wigglesworthia glossinidia endosymbiont of Glossina morsitans morsitans (Yale colony) TaxID=1142511 RepID=H6Q551_WIGGL|nr:2-amino-4-hydroxy-6-hydroxymethyldihydropteridine diphosphokinase [Wigglesworthia glossinidia]AFA41334.1 2-amino-4-hydroxy-6-hydroxymethyldihyropteridine pyrophosphokinase [Wigglesworthia glossinidia endosymbiont of Glossina morsitans morsitans (Yale colony)]
MYNTWIAIGSNIKNPKIQADCAINALKNLPNTKILACSQYYNSKPLGTRNQPNFLNAVVKLYTNLLPRELLKKIKKIENNQGRQRNSIKWGPRSLDLDILLFENNIYKFSDLIIPHYDLYNRSFFLYPLMEISPNLIFPDGTTLAYRLSKITCKKLKLWKE